MSIIVHLATQRDQPYGSTRRCCEICGVAIASVDHTGHGYTDDQREYGFLPDGYITCASVGYDPAKSK